MESLGFKCTLALSILVTESSTIIAPSIFDNSDNISGVYLQSLRAIPPEDILSNFGVDPITISAPAFLSAIKSTPTLKDWPGKSWFAFVFLLMSIFLSII